METLAAESKDLTKDDLVKGHCCRLCAVLATPRDPYAISFVPLYEECEKVAKYGVPLFQLVNSWLPLKLCPEDPYYPRNICTTCFYRMEDTISFFQHVLSGQRLLTNAINRKSVTVKQEPELTYDRNSLMTKVPRPRGRPRKEKGSAEVKGKSVEEVTQGAPLSVAERKQKRRTRPPERFGGGLYLNPFSQNLKEMNEGEEDRGNDVLRSRIKIEELDSTHTDNASFSSHEFTSVRQMDFQLDLNKLDVLMDGDEETVVMTEGHILPDSASHPQVVDLLTTSENNSGVPYAILIENESDRDDGGDLDFEEELKKSRRRRGRPKRRRFSKKSQKRYTCSYEDCLKGFSTQSGRKYHVEREHEKVIRHICTICQKGFTHARLLKFHAHTHSSEKLFKCKLCPKTFKSGPSLFTHRKHHHATGSKIRIQCPIESCAESFTLKSTLKSHMLIHNGIKPHACSVCGKAFTQQSNLRAHERIHNGVRPFPCSIPDCNKTFKTKTQLKIHEGSHAGTKSHLCPICGKGFRVHSSFRSHMLGHSGMKAHGCSLCSKRFATPRALRIHTASHTTRDKSEGDKCDCGLVFGDRSSLVNHQEECRGGLEVEDGEGLAVLEREDYDYDVNLIDNCSDEQIIVSTTEDGDVSHQDESDLVQIELYPEEAEGMEGRGEAVRYYVKIPRYVLGIVDENAE